LQYQGVKVVLEVVKNGPVEQRQPEQRQDRSRGRAPLRRSSSKEMSRRR